jgi:hypothetical protein
MNKLIYISVLFLGSVANAEENCTIIGNDTQRLACYDLNAGAIETTNSNTEDMGQ